MSASAAYALASLPVAAASGVLVAGIFAALALPGLAWAVGGWALTAATGVACGVWLASRFGGPTTQFLKALVAGTGLKLLAILGGTGLGALRGRSEALAYLAGAGAAYGPLLGMELAWFVRHSRTRSAGQEDSRP